MSDALRDRLFLLRELTLRDLKLRYVGSVMGLFWSVVHPIFTLLLYTIVFSQVIRPNWPQVETVGSFASYLFAGLLPWIQFHESISRCASIFIEHGNLIKKVKFPVELLPGSMVLSSVANQLLALCVFAAVLLFSYRSISLSVLWLAPALALQVVVTAGAGLLVATCNVFVRDVTQLLGIGFPFLFWATPIVYPPGSVPEQYRWISSANPLTHLVALYRAALLGGEAPEVSSLLYLSLFCGAIFVCGIVLLCRTRGVLSDYV